MMAAEDNEVYRLQPKPENQRNGGRPALGQAVNGLTWLCLR
jgi:hypothetical protein